MAQAVDPCPEIQRAAERQVLLQSRALVDQADCPAAFDRPGERPQQAGDYSQQTRLAGAVGPGDL
jgi:hypothetical protein